MARRETIALSLRWQCLALALFATAGCTVEIRASPPPTVVIPGPGTGEWYDLALVNIGAREAARLRDPVTAALGHSGRLILSGLVDWAAPQAALCYAETGWLVRERRQAGSEWVTLLLTRQTG
ncbi:MAG: hypothetical protein HYU88_01545 [Chloroflexi bacterium]|nr:hypothetical protein [Chloroflexota bacterium]